ncbi:unnamed protein product [Periconia digitata]|uniref:Uncharacterized protein n=1 Tax=Periconia digitata TaxID=1303443 RepID=A0A9W4XYK8_9PLEO|nr:unnamed protein product [Periconia digitata]
MKFSLATVALVSLLQITSALPTDSEANSVIPVNAATKEVLEDFDEAKNSTLEDRGFFDSYECKTAYVLKMFKSGRCDGKSTRIDMVNYPLSNEFFENKGRCEDITSKSDMLSATLNTDLNTLRVMYYSEPGCPKKAEYRKSNGIGGLCTSLFDNKAILDKKPIKSMKIYQYKKDEKCRAIYKNGIPGGGL